ncbi:hypothetical protein QJQ45_003488 [Haematococcus lacustris]|nr:hypothetical protein QJQ45_003488 [Haematococcus lacustris]
MGITHILNVCLFQARLYHVSHGSKQDRTSATSRTQTVPQCQALFRNTFTYHTVAEAPPDFQECCDFIDAAIKQQQSKVLVHCMSGVSRGPSVVVAYLMKTRAESTRLMEWEMSLHGSCSTPQGLSALIAGCGFLTDSSTFSNPVTLGQECSAAQAAQAGEAPVFGASSSPQGKQRQERRDGWGTKRRQVIKVPEGAVLRGRKKTKRKLRAHLQLRAEPASMESDSDYDSEADCESEPESQSDSESEPEPQPVTQTTPRLSSARLAALAPSEPPVPLDGEDPVMLRQLKEFSCRALLAKRQELGSIDLRGDNNSIGPHSMQLAVAMQQYYSNPGK